VARLQPQSAPDHAEALRHVQHGLERRPLERDRELAAQRVEVNLMAVIRGDHGQAGETALGGFGLQDDRQARAADQVRQVD
jgi:hypothetical protein